MTPLEIFSLILEIEQAGANTVVLYSSESHLLAVRVTFPKGHKYEKHERFYNIFVNDSKDVEAKCKELRKIKEALK